MICLIIQNLFEAFLLVNRLANQSLWMIDLTFCARCLFITIDLLFFLFSWMRFGLFEWTLFEFEWKLRLNFASQRDAKISIVVGDIFDASRLLILQILLGQWCECLFIFEFQWEIIQENLDRITFEMFFIIRWSFSFEEH